MTKKATGVYLNKITKKWAAEIRINGKTKYLGLYKTYEEAVSVRKEAEVKYGYVPVTAAPKLKNKNDLTQSKLKKLLHYDPETGDFTRIVSRGHNRIGSIAGSLTTNGYIQIKINNRVYLAHRLVFLYMNGKFPEDDLQVDHINHVKDDNRWSNLRIVTQHENQRNQSMHKTNSNGHTGIYWDKDKDKWRSRIKVAGKNISLGSFKNKDDAIAARKAAELKYDFHENHGKLKQIKGE